MDHRQLYLLAHRPEMQSPAKATSAASTTATTSTTCATIGQSLNHSTVDEATYIQVDKATVKRSRNVLSPSPSPAVTIADCVILLPTKIYPVKVKGPLTPPLLVYGPFIGHAWSTQQLPIQSEAQISGPFSFLLSFPLPTGSVFDSWFSWIRCIASPIRLLSGEREREKERELTPGDFGGFNLPGLAHLHRIECVSRSVYSESQSERTQLNSTASVFPGHFFTPFIPLLTHICMADWERDFAEKEWAKGLLAFILRGRMSARGLA